MLQLVAAHCVPVWCCARIRDGVAGTCDGREFRSSVCVPVVHNWCGLGFRVVMTQFQNLVASYDSVVGQFPCSPSVSTEHAVGVIRTDDCVSRISR